MKNNRQAWFDSPWFVWPYSVIFYAILGPILVVFFTAVVLFLIPFWLCDSFKNWSNTNA
jgi:hypothetical protein